MHSKLKKVSWKSVLIPFECTRGLRVGNVVVQRARVTRRNYFSADGKERSRRVTARMSHFRSSHSTSTFDAMLPSSHSQNLYEYPTSSSSTLYPTNSHDSLSFSSAGPSQLPTDMNAPELFNQNIKMALQFAEVIQRLAKSAADGM